MTPEEAIKTIQVAIAEVEWNYPLDYAIAFETAIKALENVNRQQAEIEALKIENQSLRSAANSYKLHYNKARIEAVKEFVEKSEMAVFVKQDEQRKQMFDILKSHRATLSYSDVEQATDNWLRGYGEAVQDVIGILDNLLKEMAGDTE